jgi:hypothetical protein
MNEKSTDYSIEDYDIEKVYPFVFIDYFINDYISGMNFDEIIKNQTTETNKTHAYWSLPYENHLKQKCLATFFFNGEEVELITRTINTKISYDMRLYESKFSEIILGEVKEVVYLNLELYSIKATYILMNNGNEYIIPYITDDLEKKCKLECEKVYDLEKFIVTMYNCYDEPVKNKKNEDLIYKNNVIKNRKKILNYKSIEQIKKINWLKTYGVVICVVLCALGFVLYKMIRKSKTKSSV